jgi:hypothetical protein
MFFQVHESSNEVGFQLGKCRAGHGFLIVQALETFLNRMLQLA